MVIQNTAIIHEQKWPRLLHPAADLLRLARQLQTGNLDLFYIESNGFAATTWLAKTLNATGIIDCSHGTRNFEAREALGSASGLGEDALITQLLNHEISSGKVCGAMHAKFPPEFRERVLAQGGLYFLAVRHPVTRIFSCHGWMKNQLAGGKQLPFEGAVQYCLQTLDKQNFDFSDILFAAAIMHIINFDYAYISHLIRQQSAFEIIQMEHYTSDETYLREIIKKINPNYSDEGTPLLSQQASNSHNRDDINLSSLTATQRRLLDNLLQSPELKKIYNALGYQY